MKAYRVMAGEREVWHPRQREAFAEARAAMLAGEDVEVDLCELRPGLGTIGALNRDRVVVSSRVVPKEIWSRRWTVASHEDQADAPTERVCACGCGAEIGGGWVGMGHRWPRKYATDKCAERVRRAARTAARQAEGRA